MRYLVVAGNFKEFQTRIKAMIDGAKSYKVRTLDRIEINDDEYIYIAKPEDIRKWHSATVVFWGTAYRRPDYSEFS